MKATLYFYDKLLDGTAFIHYVDADGTEHITHDVNFWGDSSYFRVSEHTKHHNTADYLFVRSFYHSLPLVIEEAKRIKGPFAHSMKEFFFEAESQ